MAKKSSMHLVFNYRGKLHDFMSIICGRKDNSFYFHIAGELDRPMMVGSIAKQPGNRSTITFADFRQVDLYRNKVSVHETGRIHSTGRDGKKVSDAAGGAPFDQIKHQQAYLLVAPRDPSTYPIKTAADPARDVVINLRPEEDAFFIQFWVARIGSTVSPPIHPHQLTEPLHIEWIGKNFGLILHVQKVFKGPQLDRVGWPPFSLVMHRVDDKKGSR